MESLTVLGQKILPIYQLHIHSDRSATGANGAMRQRCCGNAREWDLLFTKLFSSVLEAHRETQSGQRSSKADSRVALELIKAAEIPESVKALGPGASRVTYHHHKSLGMPL